MITRIGRYDVLARIGSGAFGSVLRAYDDELDTDVAIKILADNWAADDDIRARFRQEARILRQVRHENLVAVHDVGELDDGRPYLVMDFADRGTLANRLDSRPGDDPTVPAGTAAIANALAAALGALHDQGIVHRDINPNNILLASTGPRTARDGQRSTTMRVGLVAHDEVVLIGDLGLAKDVELSVDASVVGGTPHYQAPEQGDPTATVGPSADVYGATAVLWEIVTGSPPPIDGSAIALAEALPEAWTVFFAQGLATEPAKRPPTMHDWRYVLSTALEDGAALEGGTALVRRRTRRDRCPFKGMAAFDREDAGFFYGRESLVDEALRSLEQFRFLALGGPSGSGKSSILRAGIASAIDAGGLRGSEAWPIVVFSPSADPVAELHYQLTRPSLVTNPPATLDQLRADPSVARRLVDAITDATGGLFLGIDQFEEMFTLCDQPEERKRFVAALAGMVDPADSRVRLVSTVRADFYGACAQHPWLAQRMTENQMLVGPMTRLELRSAIEKPAERAGLRLAAGLVDLMFDDGGDEAGALPLLSHALVETWTRRDDATLTVAGYRQAGGVSGAIARTAEDLYVDRLDDAEQHAARQVLLALVTVGEGAADTRRRSGFNQLAGLHPAAEVVIAKLTDARLVAVDDSGVTIAHEALIQTWPRLRAWVDENRDDLRLRQQIIRAANAWEGQGRDHDLLYRGTPLATATAWADRHPGVLHGTASDFLGDAQRDHEAHELAEAEARAARVRVRRRAATALVALTVAALIASIGAFALSRQARSQEQLANERFAQSLGDRAEAIARTEPRLAMALALESIARAESSPPVARSALVQARQALEASPLTPVGRLALNASGSAGEPLSVALSADGHVAATGDRGGSIQLWDTADRVPLGSPLIGHQIGAQSLALNRDGSVVFSVSGDGTLRRWSVTDPADPIATFVADVGSPVWDVALVVDETVLATASEDGTVRLWDAVTGEQQGEPLIDSTFDFLSVSFSPDGSLLFAGTGRGEVIGWTVADRREVQPLTGVHQSDLWDIAIDDGNAWFITTSSDRRLCWWPIGTDGTDGRCPFDGTQADVRAPQILDSATIVVGDDTGRLRFTDGTSEIATSSAVHRQQITGSAYSADADMMVTIGLDQHIQLWAGFDVPLVEFNVGDGPEVGTYTLAWSPSSGDLAIGFDDGAVAIVDQATGSRRAASFDLLDERVSALAYSADGTLLAAAAADGSVIVVDIASGDAVLSSADAHQSEVYGLAFSGDGETLLTSSAGGVVQLFEFGQNPPTGLRIAHGRESSDAVFTADESAILLADDTGTVTTYDRGTGEQRGSSLPVAEDRIWSLSVHEDLLAVADAEFLATVWNLRTNDLVATLGPISGVVTDVAFLHDGITVVTTAGDGSVQLWDAASGRELGSRLTFDHPVWSVVVAADDRIAVVDAEGAVRVLDYFDIDRACAMIGAAFGDMERSDVLLGGGAAQGCTGR